MIWPDDFVPRKEVKICDSHQSGLLPTRFKVEWHDKFLEFRIASIGTISYFPLCFFHFYQN